MSEEFEKLVMDILWGLCCTAIGVACIVLFLAILNYLEK